MLSILELRHLRTLHALREAGNLLRAAQLLNLTQSALSHQMKLLEDHHGLALFERKSNPLRFTAAGERLLLLADAVLPQVAQAERDVARLAQGEAGQLRIAVECHTCFDWLMPAMDAFRARWPEVELDIVSGFQADPVGLLHGNRADLAIVGQQEEESVHYFPLFKFEIVALLAKDHPLCAREYLVAQDFAADTLISYPVPDDMLDIMRQVLQPAGISPAARRSSELTVAILQLVASRRGIATLPLWAAQNYLQRAYVQARRIGEQGLHASLYCACLPPLAEKAWLQDFVRIMRESSYLNLPNIELL